MKIKDDVIIKAVNNKNLKTIADILRFIGINKITGNHYRIINKIVKENNLNTSHWLGIRSNLGKSSNNRVSFLEYTKKSKNQKMRNDKIKNKLFEEELKENLCEICGIKSWQNKPITLQLHHINGNDKDNDLSNLQILCPNCHSQSDTFCLGNRNIHRKIKDEDVLHVAESCNSISDICNKLNKKKCSYYFILIKNVLKRNNFKKFII